ncbi:uncharacterized protein LOC109704329 [Ananas comosus]|uniref:ATP-dependent Clp protease proteolytic subunit n=1 Tax=Ananas comosus TaxID=4615 RepID=A0A6P5EBM2_ANACO|nr:uncharacterized protein LOC109704329 [Ananas comosus]
MRHTHPPVHRIEHFMERDTYMSPAEAKKCGLIDAMYEENDTYEFGIIRWLLASLLVFSVCDCQSKPVHLLINSPGEIVSAGLVIYDTIQSIPILVATLCLGQARSMASLLAAGTPDQRRALPNSRIMIHQPFGGFLGQASDIAIHAKEILKVRDCGVEALTDFEDLVGMNGYVRSLTQKAAEGLVNNYAGVEKGTTLAGSARSEE